MKKVILLLLFATQGYCQQIFFTIGQNYTSFKYENSMGDSSIDFQKVPGLNLEGGITYDLDKDKKIAYSGSVTFNQYNSKSYVNNRFYTWNADYLGIQNVISYNFFQTWTTFSLRAKLGFNASHIISGKQVVNNKIYDLNKESEFKGIFIQPMAGVSVNYNLNDDVYLSSGFNKVIGFNTNQNSEKLSFSTNQFFIGVHFNPK